MKISGIYQIQSRIKPERIYIGSAVNISRRWVDHLIRLKKQTHENPKLQRHYNKYGKNDLVFSIILGCGKDDLISTEQFFMDSYNPFFNIRTIAGSNLGIKKKPHTEEVKKRISKSKKGSIPWNKGKKNVYSEEVLNTMRNARVGKKHSERYKNKMRDTAISNNWGDRLPSCKGIKYSEERKQQCRDVWVKRKLGKMYNN